MTDESPVYPTVGREFAGHGSVNHSADEYVRGTFWYTNSVESYFALLKRGMMGSFHNVSEAHLYRYLTEFDFRHNYRKATDAERADDMLRGAKGKRRTYNQPNRESCGKGKSDTVRGDEGGGRTIKKKIKKTN